MATEEHGPAMYY